MESLKNQFLIAMPHMQDPWFGRSLCLICEHNDEGTMGLIINKPLELNLADILSDLKAPINNRIHDLVYCGGPVAPEQGFILHSVELTKWHSTLSVGSDICLTTSKDLLMSLGDHEHAPAHSMVILGYSGWTQGQLEREIAHNDWLLVEADAHILFEVPPEQKLTAAAQKIGVDLSLLTLHAGHA